MARKPSRRPTRSLFAQTVKAHTSGDQIQDIDLNDVDTSKVDSTPAVEPEAKEIDLTDVDTSSQINPRRAPTVSGKSSEEILAELRQQELEDQVYIRAQNRSQKIRTRPEFQPGNGFFTPASDPSEYGKQLSALKEGKGNIRPLTATDGYKHVKSLYEELNNFVTNLPSLLKSKADAHEAAAKEIAKIDPNHPEVEAHKAEAEHIRGFLGEGLDVRNNLREARDSDSNPSIIQDNARSYERALMPIKNALVEAKAKVDTVPLTQKEVEAGQGRAGTLSQNTKRTHGAIKKAHASLSSLHGMINRLVRPYGVGTPTGPAYLELRKQQIENLTDAPARPNVSGYQDIRREFEPGAEGRLSKPGHIWGDEITVGGRRTGEREQIPISEESVEMLKGRKNGKKHITRIRSIMRTGKSPEDKSEEATADRETSLFAYTDEAEQQRLTKAKAAGRLVDTEEGPVVIPSGGAPRTQKREGNKVKSVPVDPRRITTLGTHRGAVEQVGQMRAAVNETQGHIDKATRALIDGTPVPAETMAHFDSLPGDEGNAAAQQAFDRADAHSKAVNEAIESIKATGKISKEHRDLFKREGTDVPTLVRLAKGR